MRERDKGETKPRMVNAATREVQSQDGSSRFRPRIKFFCYIALISQADALPIESTTNNYRNSFGWNIGHGLLTAVLPRERCILRSP